MVLNMSPDSPRLVPACVLGRLPSSLARCAPPAWRADQDGSCRVLLREDSDALRERDPNAATELVLALTRELGHKLAINSYQLTLIDYY